MIEQFIHAGIIDPEHITTLKQYVKEDDKKRIIFLDATFVLPASPENIVNNFQENRLHSAVFFDIKSIADKNSPLPHMLPSKEQFESSLSAMGIKNDDIIILYGQHGMIMGPARVWWMFKGFGHRNVIVLNGGLPAWEAAGYETETGEPQHFNNTTYTASEFQSSMLMNMKTLIETSAQSTHPIIDARPFTRFNGSTPEPREGMRSGHIPNSKSLPCSSLVTENGQFKDTAILGALFEGIGIKTNESELDTIVTTCGSGITACALSLALYNVGYKGNVAVYDGSWSEWGLESSPTTVVT